MDCSLRLDIFNKFIVNFLPEYIGLLSKLVQIESTYGKEKIAQCVVKNKMENLGLRVNEYFSRPDDQSLNLVARIPGSDSSYKSLILNAHCDTAPVDTPSRWTRDPYSGCFDGKFVHGRGALDDKAGVVILLLVADLIIKSGIGLKGDLIIESVIEDETTGNGSKILVENNWTADGVLICDGTWPHRYIYAHLGQLLVEVVIQGEPVAACVEGRGKNPIYLGMRFIDSLKKAIFNLNKKSTPFEGIFQPYFINVGKFNSGVWFGSVPATVVMDLQIGFPDRHSYKDLLDIVIWHASQISNQIEVKLKLGIPAFRGYPDSSLSSTLSSIVFKNTHEKIQRTAVTGHCDMRHFPVPDICLYGPGGGKNPHGIDEYYMVDHIPIVSKNIFDLAIGWCNELR